MSSCLLASASALLAWYDGTLEKIFFSQNQDPLIKQQICSVLAGYVWDQANPYVRKHDTALKRLAQIIEREEKQVD